ncbi:glycine-rich domain-containing protein [Actinoplanes sp. NPDC000266]
MTVTLVTDGLAEGRTLIDPELFDRLARRIKAEHPDLDDGMPQRILDQALAFLGTSATATRPLGPSESVDIGWHTFILYTVDYAAFCERVAGRFIHHVPDDQGGTPPTIPTTLTDTMTAIRTAGFALDAALWPGTADCSTKCSQCHAGCTDSPTG